ncbi:hypothetical protein RRG08_059337 [Elysia crispata]|uniref:Uncharacterized protein n=1 Tax=Elysia crispata TaxID=231223 RepID=A0AAE1BDX8_9GAST|nr:hypothetical protein RRG08_059337 [Elysia crispata]
MGPRRGNNKEINGVNIRILFVFNGYLISSLNSWLLALQVAPHEVVSKIRCGQILVESPVTTCDLCVHLSGTGSSLVTTSSLSQASKDSDCLQLGASSFTLHSKTANSSGYVIPG